jgi:hypothetical protein
LNLRRGSKRRVGKYTDSKRPNTLYTSLKIIKVKHHCECEWVGHNSILVRMKITCKILVARPETKRQLGGNRLRWENNIQTNN